MPRIHRPTDAWLLRDGDLPSARHRELEPAFHDLENNAVFRLIIYHRRFPWLAGAMAALDGIPEERVLDFRRAAVPPKEFAVALWAAELSQGRLGDTRRLLIKIGLLLAVSPLPLGLLDSDLGELSSIFSLWVLPLLLGLLAAHPHLPSLKLSALARRIRRQARQRRWISLPHFLLQSVANISEAGLAAIFLVALGPTLMTLNSYLMPAFRAGSPARYGLTLGCLSGFAYLFGGLIGGLYSSRFRQLRGELIVELRELLRLIEEGSEPAA